MNIKQAKTIKITDFLEKSGHKPTAIKGDTCFYIAPYRKEQTASFTVNSSKNYFYDFGTGKGGDIILLTTLMHNCGISEALSILNTNPINSFSFLKQEKIEKEPNYKIISETAIQHPALINYLKSRGITNFKSSYLKEVHYKINDKLFFALGFRNEKGGYELRSKYCKICLGKKDITYVKNNNQKLLIFEGFIDYISFVQKQQINEDSNFLILNSVALLQKNISILKDYKAIELYLDSDDAGDKYTNVVLENFENAVDCRKLFSPFKDYNEWYIATELEVL